MALVDEIKKVNSWEQAVALYNKYGKKSGLKLRFSRHRSPALEKKLVYELKQLVAREIRRSPKKSEKPKSINESGSGSSVTTGLKKSQQFDKPENTKNPKASPELVLLYREQTHLHQNLESMPHDEARKQAAFRILEIETQIRLIEDGIAPKKKDPISQIPEDKGLMMKMLTNNRAYISKNKNKEKYADKVAFRTIQNIEIEKRLN